MSSLPDKQKPLTSVQVDELLQSDPVHVLAWTRQAWSTPDNPVDKSFWLRLAEAAASYARWGRGSPTGLPNRDWAEVATTIYDSLAGFGDGDEAKSHALTSMMLRAFMISRVGPSPGDPVLDAQRVYSWFVEGLPFSFREATEKSASWKRLDTGQIRELRRLKNHLAVMQLLIDAGYLTADDDLRRWLSLRDRLP
jgi:hypothetical protein